MASLLDLATRLEAINDRIPKAANELAIESAIAVVSDLSIKTPVDTSQALSNWIVTLENPSSITIKAHYEGKRGSTKGTSAAETISKARVALANKKAGQKIYIANNLDYIRWLNDGNSTQEPEGFVERATLIGRKFLKRFKLRG